ncbi:MAG TPA: hypothetical protein VNM69_23135 [Bacillus sp. (in: firmicutes)]|nr:hypothetical protein [Bacillus sp. (in: firmicutes)]
MSENTRLKFDKNDIAIFIAPITAVCYGLAYIQELGKYIYYGIPISFIELNLNSLTVTILTMFPIFAGAIIFLYSLLKRIRNERLNRERTQTENDRPKLLKKSIIVSILAGVYLIVLIYITYVLLDYYGSILLIPIVIGITTPLAIIFLYFLYKRKNFVSTLILGLFYLGLISFGFGFGLSGGDEHHNVLKIENEHFLLLETYMDSYFLLSPVDIEKKEFKREIIIKEINDTDYKIFQKKIRIKPTR